MDTFERRYHKMFLIIPIAIMYVMYFGMEVLKHKDIMVAANIHFSIAARSLTVLLVVEIFRRICIYLRARREYRVTLIQVLTSENLMRYLIFVLFVYIVTLMNSSPEKSLTDECTESVYILLTIGPSYLILHLLCVNYSAVDIDNALEETNLQLGHAFALVYYYGYLRFVLPGINGKDMKERIEDYESTHGVTIPMKKIIILIPWSGFCGNLDTAGQDEITTAGCLEPLVMDRGGVRDRVYKSTVYRVKSKEDEKPLYVVTEGATTILSLYEMRKGLGIRGLSPEDCHKEVRNFHRSLTKILTEDRNCNDQYYLHYYDDENVNIANELRMVVNDQLLEINRARI